jgi:cell division septation protein DedD
MIARRVTTLLLTAVISTALQAQDSAATATRDTLYRRAQRLVNEGKGDQGRAIVDSLLKAAAPGSAAYAEGLFWRASLATTAAEAERDYRQITVDFALSPRTEDALLRLAQLELQRGDRPAALAHLERLFRENGTGTSRARAGYWMARVYFEMNDATRACSALADSRAAISPADVELSNQVDYLAQRCPRVAAAARPTQSVPPPAPLPVVPDTVVARVDSTASVPPSSPPSAAPPVAAKPPVTPPPTVTKPAPAKTAPASAEPQRFSVQVAAYGTVAEAQRLVKKYRANGYDARVAGTVAPFRVRIGRFKTRPEAAALAKVLKEKSGAAFVVVAEAK